MWSGFVKSVQAYEKADVPISCISPQNEPMGTPSWPGMFLSSYQGPLSSDTGGIPMCRGLLTIDPADGRVSYNVDYYALAHASRFVKPGARRIYSNTFGEGSMENVAFKNPDGSKVLIAYNSGSAAKTFSVADGTHSFDYTLKAGDAVTFTYSGPERSGGTPAVTKVSDPTHDFVFKSPSGLTAPP
jgi:O-glycosyl hydrolase